MPMRITPHRHFCVWYIYVSAPCKEIHRLCFLVFDDGLSACDDIGTNRLQRAYVQLLLRNAPSTSMWALR